jgi:hypothetical protein
MTDPNELEALKASFRGALGTAAALDALKGKVAALGPHHDIGTAELEELARVTLAHAVSSHALRGLVETMRARRETGAA